MRTLIRRTRGKFTLMIGAAGLTVALAVVMAGSASASPIATPSPIASPSAAPTKQAPASSTTKSKYCQVLVGPSKTSANRDAVVLAETCWQYTKQQADAATKAPYAGTKLSAAVKTLTALPTPQGGGLLLFSMYENSYANAYVAGQASSVYWNGSYYSDPCDSAGYSVTLNSTWRSIVSSFRQGDVSCPKLRLYNKPLTGYAEFSANVNTLGGYNDNVGKVNSHA